MVLLSIQLTLAVALAAAPADKAAPGAGTRAGSMASTYDQATCATVLAGEDLDDTASDGWALAAIGEDAPALPTATSCAVLTSVRPPVAADCGDPLASQLDVRITGEMIGTCAVPRATSRPGLRAARPVNGPERRSRTLFELGFRDRAAPLGPKSSSTERPIGPLLLGTTPRLPLPEGALALEPWATPTLSSIHGDRLLRPPRV